MRNGLLHQFKFSFAECVSLSRRRFAALFSHNASLFRWINWNPTYERKYGRTIPVWRPYTIIRAFKRWGSIPRSPWIFLPFQEVWPTFKTQVYTRHSRTEHSKAHIIADFQQLCKRFVLVGYTYINRSSCVKWKFAKIIVPGCLVKFWKKVKKFSALPLSFSFIKNSF